MSIENVGVNNKFSQNGFIHLAKVLLDTPLRGLQKEIESCWVLTRSFLILATYLIRCKRGHIALSFLISGVITLTELLPGEVSH